MFIFSDYKFITKEKCKNIVKFEENIIHKHYSEITIHHFGYVVEKGLYYKYIFYFTFSVKIKF